MAINIDEKKVKHGLLGLVLALIEIIRDALRLQAVRRVEGANLTEEEVERLGNAFMELDKAIEQIKKEQGISEAVASVREGLDDLVDDALHTVVVPGAMEAVNRAAEDERRDTICQHAERDRWEYSHAGSANLRRTPSAYVLPWCGLLRRTAGHRPHDVSRGAARFRAACHTARSLLFQLRCGGRALPERDRTFA